MPDPVEDGFTGDQDPLSDTTEETTESTPEAGASETTELPETEDGEVESEGQDPEGATALAGTPFKTQAALVNGYKNIQRLAGAKDREIAQIKRQLEIAIDAIQKFSGKGAEPKKAEFTVPQGDDFWKEMAKDPSGFITKMVQSEAEKLMEAKYGSKLQTLESGFGSIQNSNRVNEFVRLHPEFTQEDEDQMVELLDANPHLKQQADGLETAYDRVIAARYRASNAKAATAGAVAGAKSVAGLGGKKTSLPSSVKKEKDPFDEVLELDKQDRELYKLGKK
jgi:hypothetical protein